ncbi:arsenate reductase (glutaredoxin) [Olleya aquimaris]|uniref:Arsenate reductase n=1 Tax=Olleya aquimaris TaxID=639310 RepID=A0A327RJT9_9FLAO|nr:arsenate reductase (glutaredoxin) [Olleya aquimaris]RAJ16252.1 arsenate reductase [Olleya aquimaris]
MIKIYHNPRCRKSREGLQILEEANQEFEIIKYLEDTLSIQELEQLISILKIKPIDLVRQNESIWKELYKNKSLTDSQILEALATYPKLIERPIVTNKTKAIIGRPPEIIKTII